MNFRYLSILGLFLLFSGTLLQAQLSYSDLARIEFESEPFVNEIREKHYKGQVPNEHIVRVMVYYDNDHKLKKSMGYMVNGYKDGPWLTWHKNGKKESEGIYKDEVMTGQWKYWYENGNLRKETQYLAGEKNGIWRLFHEDTKRVREQVIYNKGQREGKYNMWYPDGKPHAEGYYMLGLKEGMWKEFHPNGEVSIEALFKKGLADGKTVNYDQFGNKTREATFIKGEIKSGTQQIKIVPKSELLEEENNK